MDRVEYKRFVVTLSDADTNKLNEAWNGAAKHWTCKVRDTTNRKQMSFDVFGGLNATMQPLRALYLYCDDACIYSCLMDARELQEEYGYNTYAQAKRAWSKLEKTYYKCRKFIGSDDDIIEIANELREEWG